MLPPSMPRLSPLHDRTSAACSTYRYKEWAGYVAVCQYGPSLEGEYHALRHGAGLLDVTPLCKYQVAGPDAAAMLSRLSVRDLSKLRLHRSSYLCWCDPEGHVIDDGTCTRLDEQRYRLTSAAPALHWLLRQADGFDVAITDESEALAALALQGPTSRAILSRLADVEGLRYFRAMPATLGGGEGWITRTGYTGDLGYELWVEADRAPVLWDALIDAGRSLGIEPVGLDALDVVRLEAGLVMRDVDYLGAPDTQAASQRVTPFELGFDWMVDLQRDPPFVGQGALRAKARPGRRMVGLEIDQVAVEALFEMAGLPLGMDGHAWRDAIPVYAHGAHVGKATSGCWSPLLKQMIALALIDAEACEPGVELFIEHSVDGVRHTVPARRRELPFLNLERRKA